MKNDTKDPWFVFTGRPFKLVKTFKSYKAAINFVDRENEKAKDWHKYRCSQHDLTLFNK